MADAREAAKVLAEEILTDVELGDATLEAVMLKSARLARLVGDETRREIFGYEAGGYPGNPNGIPNAIFEMGRIVGRVQTSSNFSGENEEQMSRLSVGAMEAQVKASELALANSQDPNVSLSSANPNQTVFAPVGNRKSRDDLRRIIAKMTANLATSRTFAYDFASSVLYELEFSQTAESIFARLSDDIDRKMLERTGSAPRKTASIAQNLASENPEDWANAVHSCRRLLQEVADVLFPVRTPETRNGKEIRLGQDQYVNRLVCFIEDRLGSKVSQNVIGTTLQHIGHRLDAIFNAAQKGSHTEINAKSEAERYVVYTYLLVGDVLAVADGD